MENSSEGIPTDIKVVHICDREGDIYELFEKAINTNNLFLIRVVQNRLTVDSKKIIDEIKKEIPIGNTKVLR